MKIINSEEYRYDKFHNGYHVFVRRDLSGYEAYKEAKIIIRPANVVILAKPDGDIVPTYATVKRYSPEQISAFVSEAKCGLLVSVSV